MLIYGNNCMHSRPCSYNAHISTISRLTPRYTVIASLFVHLGICSATESTRSFATHFVFLFQTVSKIISQFQCPGFQKRPRAHFHSRLFLTLDGSAADGLMHDSNSSWLRGDQLQPDDDYFSNTPHLDLRHTANRSVSLSSVHS